MISEAENVAKNTLVETPMSRAISSARTAGM
jgi:hypothetical protein